MRALQHRKGPYFMQVELLRLPWHGRSPRSKSMGVRGRVCPQQLLPLVGYRTSSMLRWPCRPRPAPIPPTRRSLRQTFIVGDSWPGQDVPGLCTPQESTGTVGPAYTAHCRRSLLSTSLPTSRAYRSAVPESNGEHITRRSSGIGIRHLRVFMDEQVD